MTLTKGFPVQTTDGIVYVRFDQAENEYVATMNSFEGCASTQEKAIALCLAVRRDTLMGEDED